MRIPPQIVIFRIVTVTITALILLTVGLGLAGWGPLGALGARTSQADQLVHILRAKGWLA